MLAEFERLRSDNSRIFQRPHPIATGRDSEVFLFRSQKKEFVAKVYKELDISRIALYQKLTNQISHDISKSGLSVTADGHRIPLQVLPIEEVGEILVWRLETCQVSEGV